MNEMNQWFYSLTLNELQEYVHKLEEENERLVRELDNSSKLNYLLECVAKSTQKGYSILRSIEINKNCECNETLNKELRITLNESINQTNSLLKVLNSYQASNALMPEPKVEMIDLTADQTSKASNIRHSLDDKESTTSSGYDSTGYATDRSSIGSDKGPEQNYMAITTTITPVTESQSPRAPFRAQLPQSLPDHKSRPLNSSITQPLMGCNSNNCLSIHPKLSTLSPTGATVGAIHVDNMPLHLPNKCPKCDLSFNLKQSLEQHLLTHISLNPTLSFQKMGRGRPAKNDSRVLRVTDSELNIIRMNNGLISHTALEDLRRFKFINATGRYRCPWPDCGYTPHFLRDLRRHMFKHTGDKKFKCNVEGCDFVTVWRTSLIQHQRKKHNMNDHNIVVANH